MGLSNSASAFPGRGSSVGKLVWEIHLFSTGSVLEKTTLASIYTCAATFGVTTYVAQNQWGPFPKAATPTQLPLITIWQKENQDAAIAL